MSTWPGPRPTDFGDAKGCVYGKNTIYILYIYYTWKCLFVRTTNLRKPAYVNQKSSAPHSFRSCNSYTGPQATEIDHPHHPGPKTAISLCTWGLQKGAWEQSAVDDGATNMERWNTFA